MKKFLLLLLVTAMFLTLCGCQKNNDNSSNNDNIRNNLPEKQEPTEPNYDFSGEDYITFFPTEPSQLGVDEFKALFDSGIYDEKVTSLEYREVYSYMPEDIVSKYDINAFEMMCYRDGEYVESRYYILYNGNLTTANPIGSNPDNNKGFVHFAMTDVNSDGYYELLCSYNQNRINDRGIYFSFSYLTIVDSKSNIAICEHATYEGSVFFKPNARGELSAYTSENHKIEKAETLLMTFKPNTVKYTFKQRVIELTSENYKVEITFAEGNAHFPIRCEGIILYFDVNVKMTYLGETFTYVNSNTYLEGALPKFVSKDDTLEMDGWFAGEAITTFTVKTGDIIDRNYKFLERYTSISEGTYDMYVTYRGEEVFAEDVITITR